MLCLWNVQKLLSLLNISKWYTDNVTDIGGIFYGCSSLYSLPDKSRWNINKVTNMNNVFYKCLSLSSLPNISKLNTNNVTNLWIIFYNCSYLSSLPDISKWNTSKLFLWMECLLFVKSYYHYQIFPIGIQIMWLIFLVYSIIVHY